MQRLHDHRRASRDGTGWSFIRLDVSEDTRVEGVGGSERVRVDYRVSWDPPALVGGVPVWGNWDNSGKRVRARIDRDSIGGKRCEGEERIREAGRGTREPGRRWDKERRRSLGRGGVDSAVRQMGILLLLT